MKKMKNILLMSILAVSSFCLIGMGTVNAAFTVSRWSLVCDPTSVEAGSTSKCYLTAPMNANVAASSSAHGFMTYAYVTDELLLKDAKVNTAIGSVNSVFTKAQSASAQDFSANSDMADKIKQNLRCSFDTSTNTDGSRLVPEDAEFGCALFYTTTASTDNAFTVVNVKKGVAANMIPTNAAVGDYGVLGYYEVQVSADAKKENCGELCVKTWDIPTVNDYGSADYDGSGVSYVCEEIHKLTTDDPEVIPDEDPDTGAFASYTVLIAGALIAISAIVIAKKNNKVYRV